MTDEDFDSTLVAAGLAQAASAGWAAMTVAGAAQAAGLDCARARSRFAGKAAVLLGLGALCDRAALSGLDPDSAAPVQERLFDMLMRRFDVLQAHRAGVLALLAALPIDPMAALILARADLASMRWLLEAAGVSANAGLDSLRASGLLAVWLWTVRSWQRDDSPDLSGTMATLDAALARAAQVARSLPGAPTPARPAEAALPEVIG